MDRTIKGDLLGAALSQGATVVNLREEKMKEREKLAAKLNKKVEDLTPEEKAEADYIPALDDPCDAFRD